MQNKKARLILEDGTIFKGNAAGSQTSSAGEVVFATGMVGYDLSLTDPSYAGQILTFTYPLIGNWGVPPKEFWESDKIQVAGLVVSDLTTKPSHWQSQQTLDEWLKEEGVSAIFGIDTRLLTQKLRDRGVMLGKIVVEDQDIEFYDPNAENLVAKVSPKEPKILKSEIRNPKSEIRVGLLNCGAKRNILRSLLARGVTVYDLPWNFDPFVSDGWQSWKGSRQRGPRTFTNPDQNHKYQTNLKVRGSTDGKETTDRTRPEFPKLDGLVISNGPGDPKMAKETINIIKKALKKKIPTFGICLGNQLLALATGGDTYKLKFGHRAQNQPTIQAGTKRCYITTQNHGFAVDEKKMPKGFKRWFHNANDNTNEGIIHENLSFFSVQFHPEASPGPTDTEWLFDYFLEKFK
ncbi:hypothetical protein A2683_02105 [Candidatus Curtissbacteria bacterium RIFCSPHIGHO2_01_FULL_34_40]|nr:MAG: hypothetical protein A2683_02105 [Candidatus Curtissbacteria bacterium RIFCSPHIGHO2_01_FULL_34_40]